jgi:hypothetical protein
MKIVNCTPHTPNIIAISGEVVTVQPSGTVARVKSSRVEIYQIDGIVIEMVAYGEVENLPEPADDTVYIVSMLVAQRAKREDIFSPGELVRDESGQPIGCKGLAAN